MHRVYCRIKRKGTLVIAALFLSWALSTAERSTTTNAASFLASVTQSYEVDEAQEHAHDQTLSSNDVNGVPYTLSSRIGEEIDHNERKYFHLFPHIRDFEKACSFLQSTGDVAFVIKRSDTGIAEDKTIIISAEVAEQIVIFIEHYEPIRARKYVFDYLAIKDFVGLPAVSCTTTRTAGVSLQDGGAYTAQILHAEDSVLILWKGVGVYDWYDVAENAIYVPYHMIRAVTFKESTMMKSGLTCSFLSGCLIGGAAGALMGLASGGSEEDTGWFVLSFSAEDMALMGGVGGAVLGGVAGGIAGVVRGAGEGHAIRSDFQTYQSLRLLLNKNAVFPDRIPLELKNYLISPRSHSDL